MANINRVTITGNLTRDPEVKTLDSGNSVGKLGVAVNDRRKDNTGQWVDVPYYFDVTVWGKQAENCAQYLSQGSSVAVDGKLEWRSWEDNEGNRRSAVGIVAQTVQFIGEKSTGGNSETSTNDDEDASIPF